MDGEEGMGEEKQDAKGKSTCTARNMIFVGLVIRRIRGAIAYIRAEARMNSINSKPQS